MQTLRCLWEGLIASKLGADEVDENVAANQNLPL